MIINYNDSLQIAETLVNQYKNIDSLKHLNQKQRKISLLALKNSMTNQMFDKIGPYLKGCESILSNKLFNNFKNRQFQNWSHIFNVPKLIKHVINIVLNLLGLRISKHQLNESINSYRQLKVKEQEELQGLPKKITHLKNAIQGIEQAIMIVRNYSLPIAQMTSQHLEKNPIDLNQTITTFQTMLEETNDEDLKRAIQDHLKGLTNLNKAKNFALELQVMRQQHRVLLQTYPLTIEKNQTEELPKLEKRLQALLSRQKFLREKFDIIQSQSSI